MKDPLSLLEYRYVGNALFNERMMGKQTFRTKTRKWKTHSLLYNRRKRQLPGRLRFLVRRSEPQSDKGCRPW